jgi:hypothetical protein
LPCFLASGVIAALEIIANATIGELQVNEAIDHDRRRYLSMAVAGIDADRF